jgi:Amidase
MIARGEDPGPLAGVPVTTKINVDQAGFATTNGIRLQKDLVAQTNSPVVDNLLRAGARSPRPHQCSGIRASLVHEQSASRQHTQPAQSLADAGRLVRRRGGGLNHSESRRILKEIANRGGPGQPFSVSGRDRCSVPHWQSRKIGYRTGAAKVAQVDNKDKVTFLVRAPTPQAWSPNRVAFVASSLRLRAATSSKVAPVSARITVAPVSASYRRVMTST